MKSSTKNIYLFAVCTVLAAGVALPAAAPVEGSALNHMLQQHAQ